MKNEHYNIRCQLQALFIMGFGYIIFVYVFIIDAEISTDYVSTL